MGTSYQRKSRYAGFSEINVTPFVDVMLVLLVIFMVTAPMLQQSLNLTVPSTKALSSPIPKNPFILKIKKNRKIYIGSKVIPLKDMQAKLKALFKVRENKSVYVEADKSVPYGIVAETLAEIQASGSFRIHLVTTTK